MVALTTSHIRQEKETKIERKTVQNHLANELLRNLTANKT